MDIKKMEVKSKTIDGHEESLELKALPDKARHMLQDFDSNGDGTATNMTSYQHHTVFILKLS